MPFSYVSFKRLSNAVTELFSHELGETSPIISQSILPSRPTLTWLHVENIVRETG